MEEQESGMEGVVLPTWWPRDDGGHGCSLVLQLIMRFINFGSEKLVSWREFDVFLVDWSYLLLLCSTILLIMCPPSCWENLLKHIIVKDYDPIGSAEVGTYKNTAGSQYVVKTDVYYDAWHPQWARLSNAWKGIDVQGTKKTSFEGVTTVGRILLPNAWRSDLHSIHVAFMTS